MSLLAEQRAAQCGVFFGDQVLEVTLKPSHALAQGGVGSGENANYDKSAVKRFKRPVKVAYMEDTPSAEETLDLAMKGK